MEYYLWKLMCWCGVAWFIAHVGYMAAIALSIAPEPIRLNWAIGSLGISFVIGFFSFVVLVAMMDD